MKLLEEYNDFFKKAEREELINELKKYIRLLGINEIISSSFDLEKVLKEVLYQGSKLTEADIASIFLINKEENVLEFAATTDPNHEKLEKIKVPMGKGISGYVAETGKIVNTADVQNDARFYKNVDHITGETTKSYLCVPLKVRDEIIGTAQLMNKKNNCEFTEDDIRISRAFASQAAIAIERVLLHNEAVIREKMEKELKVAANIQQQLLPQKNPQIDGYSIAGISIPAKEVGGDYFNYIVHQKNNETEYVDFTVADVSGKGIPAALIVSNFHACLNLLLPLYENLGDLAYHLNNYMKKNLIMGNFITFFLMRLEIKTGGVTYINCGHNPPYYFLLADNKKEIKTFQRSGPVLGLIDDVKYKVFETTLSKGDMIIPFSDGVEEAHNEKNELFGEDRILESAHECYQKASAKKLSDNEFSKYIVEQMIKTVDEYRGEAEVNDDTTLEVIYRYP
ncbi:MAG: SpoIIE family protein phosphatase [Spirochaetia bacterium]|nr:SpoIIE family protein phosphatase [Spirochaetia bacterium]